MIHRAYVWYIEKKSIILCCPGSHTVTRPRRTRSLLARGRREAGLLCLQQTDMPCSWVSLCADDQPHEWDHGVSTTALDWDLKIGKVSLKVFEQGCGRCWSGWEARLGYNPADPGPHSRQFTPGLKVGRNRQEKQIRQRQGRKRGA